MSISQKLKPGIPKRALLAVAGIFWTIGGGMLMWRGVSGLLAYGANIYFEVPLGLLTGWLFFILLFVRISRKHIDRILSIKIKKPCLFSFFDVRGYILMAIMISGGVALRLFNVLNPQVLCTFYITMGVPLLLSAFRFYYNWYIYNNSDWTHAEDSF